nr:DUF6281 family protein [Streptomyces sp. NBC_00995]
MKRIVRSAGLLGAAAIVMSMAACTAEGGGTASNKCVVRYTYQDATYTDVANVKFTPGKKLGVATAPPCDDTGGQEENEEPADLETAYEVQGLSPEVAIAVGDTPETAMFLAVSSDSGLPPEVQKLIDGS